MAVLLIQVNGAKIREQAPPGHLKAGGQGPRYCDDPVVHRQYINGGDHWKREGFGRPNAWEVAASGDIALLYSTSNVHEDWGASLSHVLHVENKVIDDDGAQMYFDKVVELQPKIEYGEIQRLINSGRFSEKMRYCGQQGFNITQIESRDFETLRELTKSDLGQLEK